MLWGGVSCAPSAEKKAEALQTEVMAQHDSAMAKMGALFNSRKGLALLKDSLPDSDSLAQQALTKGISDLALADERMMQWMRAYRAPNVAAPDSALPYLTKEKVKIEIVRQNIEQSLEEAKKLFTQYAAK